MVVYSSEEAFREVAEEIAAARETEVVSTLGGFDETEPVVYVDPPQDIDEAVLLRLQKRHLRRGPRDARFSVVTGFTPELAEELYFRDYSGGTDHALFSTYSPGEYRSEESLDVYAGNEVSATNIAAAQSDERLASLCLFSGGWSMHLNLREGYLCGFPESVSPDDYDGQRPYCVEDGERNCPYEGELLAAESVDADDVFVPSCASVVDNDYTGLPLHVGTGLLSSATTLIGSYQVSPNLPSEGLLHYSLVREGYSLAHRCYVLNRNTSSIDLKPYPYVPFGRPEATPPAGASGEYSADVTVEEGDAVVTLTDVDAHLLRVTVPARDVESSDDYYLHVEADDRDLPLYYFVADDGDELSVFAYSGGKIEAERLQFRVSPNPVRHEDRRAFVESALNATQLKSVGLLNTNKGVNQEENLLHELYGICETLSTERYFVGEHDEVGEKIDAVLHKANQIGGQVIDSVAENGYPVNTYAKRMMEADVGAAPYDCHTCGRPLLRREGTDITGNYRRATSVCPRCGPTYDVPSEAGRDDPYPRVEGELVEGVSGETPVTVSFRNPRDHRMYGTVQLTLSDFANSYTEPVESARREFRLESGGRAKLEFTVDVDQLEPNFYQIFAYIAGNNELYAGMTPIIVGEEVGFRY